MLELLEFLFSNFLNLLIKDSILQKFQNNLRNLLSKGNIEVLDKIYNLKVTNNKREY